MAVPCLFLILLCNTLCPFWFCNHFDGAEVVLLWLSSWCRVIVIVLWLSLAVPRVGLQCVIVVFPDLELYHHMQIFHVVFHRGQYCNPF